MLSWGGWVFDVLPADIDESLLDNENPEEHVLRLAERKALHIARKVTEDKVIIAADTIVVDGNQILGKPANFEEAKKMLKQLKGRTHQVKTAIVMVSKGGKEMVSEVVTTNVPMRNYSEIEIEDYIATGDPFDKAGAYAIQNKEFQPVKQLSGCFANVAGLPLCHLTRMMKSKHFTFEGVVANECKKAFDYDCDITQTIL